MTPLAGQLVPSRIGDCSVTDPPLSNSPIDDTVASENDHLSTLGPRWIVWYTFRWVSRPW